MASEQDEGMLKWVTLFDKMNEEAEGKQKKAGKDGGGVVDGAGDAKGGPKSNKRLSVERIYQKKSQLEHILLRPDSYIGSVERVQQPMWVFDEIQECMVQREISYVPGLYKIFDEILVNAADNKQRDPKNMTTIKIDIDPEANKVKIWNNGKGIPIVEHKAEKMYVPTLIFGHLLTSSNYDDSQKKVTGGRNGYGAKLCNIFSTKFTVETQANDYKKAFKQTWSNNMAKVTEAKIVASHGEDYTCITFHPDLPKFKMEKLDKDIVDLFSRRAYDMAGSSRGGVKVYLNGKRLPIKNFKDYVELYTKGKMDENDQPLKVVHEIVNDRWEIALSLSEKGYQQVSFSNSIATTKGGRHVDYVTDHLVTKLIEMIKRKEKKGGIQIKPFQVKNHLWVFVNSLIENPTFDSQTKENMTLQAKSFGSKCAISEKFVNATAKCGIVEAIQTWMRFKQQTQLNKKMSSAKHSKLKGIPKLDDANDAGTRNSGDCTLILTEGDSAKTLAVSGMCVVGRDKYGVFPLRGKVLNVREATHKQIMENAEINNIIKIMGLRYKEKYDTPESMKTLRYGRLMIMTDQDQDGSHIKGLLINFIHHNWPSLLRQNFLEEFITPIVKVTKSNQTKAFYSLPEFEEWKTETDKWNTWKIKYYKGLGTSTAKEAKEYFSDMLRHRIPFKYEGTEDDASIQLAFSKKKIEERKEWLTNWMEERKRRAMLGLPEIYLYSKLTKVVSYQEFVNRELILFSNMDNERSIPSLVDGLKPGQRKVMFACFKRNLVKEIKVAQLAGNVAEKSSYHHGEVSLMSTIIGLAQNFVGSNNINLLHPEGQFGTRLHGGKDSASPRYIFTYLSTLSRHIFNVHDDPLLKSLFDDNQRIEPEWYMPIIPMVLVNGAEGIGTGWSTKIPNYDPRAIVRNIRRMMNNEEPEPMMPWFKNFKGSIEELEEQKYVINGELAIIDDQTIEITELPVRTWTQAYKEGVLEPMLQGTDKVPAMITDYKEYHTDTTVKFVVKMSPEKMAHAEEQGLHKVFKLQSTWSTASMVLFDSNGCIKRYTRVDEILREFFDLRMDLYRRRKDYLEGSLAAESLKLDNIARFICEKIEGTIVIENKAKKDIIQTLVRRGYDSDPVKTWKGAQNHLQPLEDSAENEQGEDTQEREETTASSGGPDFNYLLSLPLWALTKERKDELLKQRDAKAEELYKLRRKTPKVLWTDDLKAFEDELEIVQQKERDDEVMGVVTTKSGKGGGGKPRVKKVAVLETRPSPMGRRVEPRIDAALRAKAAAAGAKKKKIQEKKEAVLLGVDDDLMMVDDEDEPMSLADRIGAGNSPIKGNDKKVVTSTKPKSKQQSLFDAFSKAKARPAKTAKPQPAKADGADSDVQIQDIDSGDDDDDELFAGKKKTNQVLALESGSENETRATASTESSASPEKAVAAAGEKKKRAPKKKKEFDSDSDGEPKQKKKGKKNRRPWETDSEDEWAGKSKKKAKLDESDEDDFDMAADESFDSSLRERAGRSRQPVKYDFGEESEEEKQQDAAIEDDLRFEESEDDAAPQPAAPKQWPSEPKTNGNDVFPVDSDREDSISEASVSSVESLPPSPKPEPKKAAPRPKKDADAPPKKKRAPKKKPVAFDSDDEDLLLLGDDQAKKPKKSTAAKKPRAPKKKKTDWLEGSEDEDDFAPKAKTKPSKSKKVASDDEFGMDDEDFSYEPAARGGGRSRAPVKYNFGEESDLDSD